MADIFGTDNRGCFSVAPVNASGSGGATLLLPNSSITTSGFADPYLVTSLRMENNEAISHNKTFGGDVYSYAFGHDPNSSYLTASFTVFLGAEEDGLSDLYGAYKDSRVYESMAMAQFSLGSASVAGYVVAMSSSTVDPEHNLQDFSMRLAIAEL